MEGGEASYCMYATLHMNMLPSVFSNLCQKEKAFIIACIDIKIEAEEKQKSKMKK